MKPNEPINNNELTAALKQLRIIYGAALLGLCLLLTISFFFVQLQLVQLNTVDLKELGIIFLLAYIGICGVALFVPFFVPKLFLEQLNTSPNKPELGKLLSIFRTVRFISLATLEAPALIGCIFAVVLNQPWYFVGVIFFIYQVFRQLPSEQAFSKFC